MSQTLKTAMAVVGIDIGKNSFHVVGLDQRCCVDPLRSPPETGHIAAAQQAKVTGQWPAVDRLRCEIRGDWKRQLAFQEP